MYVQISTACIHSLDTYRNVGELPVWGQCITLRQKIWHTKYFLKQLHQVQLNSVTKHPQRKIILKNLLRFRDQRNLMSTFFSYRNQK